ncbi:MAG TPA: tyrosine-type recombinase/integrase, partial [Candidatus Dormibacteraeota bacterium]
LDNRVLNRLSAQLLAEGNVRGKLSEHSVHAYARAINHFLSWAKKEGEHVDGRAQLPRLPQRLIDILSREEIERLEDAAKTERDKLIVRLLADTGIRVGELVGMRTGNLIQRDRQYFVKVRGKGDKERLAPVSPAFYRRLVRYAERGRPRDAATDRLFLALKRRPGGADYEPLTSSGVEQLIRNLGATAGLSKRVHPHLFRHSAATWMLRRGMNPMLVAQILGHESLQMIQRVYAHLTPGDSYEAMLKVLQEP